MVIQITYRSGRLDGFTLVELVVAMSLIAIMSLAALQGFNTVVESLRVKNATYDLFAAMQLAKSEAIKRNVNVTITPASTWENGWDIASGGELILRQPPIPGVRMTGGPADVTFTRTGRLPNGVLSPRFQIKGATQASKVFRCIKIDLGGQPRARTGEC